LYIQGFLSSSSDITIRFDIYDRTGKLIKDKIRFQWTAQGSNSTFSGYNSAKYSSAAYGGDQDSARLIESFDGSDAFISNYQRIRLRITSGDKVPHIINWVSIDSQEKVKIRRRKLTKLT